MVLDPMCKSTVLRFYLASPHRSDPPPNLAQSLDCLEHNAEHTTLMVTGSWRKRGCVAEKEIP